MITAPLRVVRSLNLLYSSSRYIYIYIYMLCKKTVLIKKIRSNRFFFFPGWGGGGGDFAKGKWL